MLEKIEIDITGKIFGYRKEGEDRNTAAARILLEAEQHGNCGESRLHLAPKRHGIKMHEADQSAGDVLRQA